MEDLPVRLKRLMAIRRPTLQAEWKARPAAVLVPLYRAEGSWHVLYTRRTDSLEDHRGQVSFPGGRIEPEDSGPAEAALREAGEEIGIQPQDVQILGELDPLMTVTQFLIAPVVGTLPWPYPLRPNPAEVANAFGVPLRWLADPENLQMKERKPIAPGPSIPVYYFKPFKGEVIWGATARITLNLLGLLREEG